MARHKVLRSPRLALKEQKRRTQRTLLFSILFFLTLFGIVYGFSRPQFRITHIEVSGSSRISKEQVVEAAQKGMSGTYVWLFPKSHTLLYPKSQIKKTLLSEFPAFSRVSISLQSLATLRVTVHEREPHALWCADPYGCFLIDESGFAFSEAELGAEGKYYEFEKTSTSSPFGAHVIEEDRLSELILFLTELEKFEFNPEKVLLKEDRELEVLLQGNTRLLLREGDYTRVLRSLNALLAEGDVLPRTHDSLSVAYIDLRYGNKIYFKPR